MALERKYFAPGRVNLIGEHLDYNGGLVMPCAIDLGISATVTNHSEGEIKFTSEAHANEFHFQISALPEFQQKNEWSNYPLGIFKHLQNEGLNLPSISISYDSNLPEGSGLSSSAAIEVLTAYIVQDLLEIQIDRKQLAQFCQKVENVFIGVKCGIMDQFAVANGKKEHAILLDCNTLSHEHIPFELDDYRLLILNSKKPRSLIKSAYNERKASCDEALRLLQQHAPIQTLAEARMEHLLLLKDEELIKRARHVIAEQLRVNLSKKMLENGDLFTFGKLMNASHASLKDDFEVSGFELDTLAETAQELPGCLGARMTGAGFGGCAIAIVKKESIPAFSEVVATSYSKATGMNCEVYETFASDGVGRLNN
jgi:galactokinase